jgi:chromosome segregation ATPase
MVVLKKFWRLGVKMTDRNQDDSSQGSKQVRNTKTLDTFFPSTWLLVLMVGVVLVFNVIVGIKVFSLQKEKAVIEILKTRYESYEKIIRDVEDKEERLRILTQEIVPLEKRSENALKETTASNERVGKNKEELDKITASKSEAVERLNSAQATTAELSNERQTLRKENDKLEKMVAELNVEEKRLEQEITKKGQRLRSTEENILAAEVKLKDQEKYIKDVSAANSSFEALRGQLSEFVKKMNETQANAGDRIKDLKEVIASITVEKNHLSSQTVNLTNEAKFFAQSNAAITEEVKGLKGQSKEYKSEVESIATTSGQMKSIAVAIKGSATNLEIGEAQVSVNAKIIKGNLEQIGTTGQELAQTSKHFTTAVAGIASQGEKIDKYLQKIADLPDMKAQAIAFQKILREIEDLTKKLSERVAAVQSSFIGKLDGMNLSFGALEKDFTEISLKIDGVKQTLEKMATRTPEMNKESQKTDSPAE